MKYVPILMLLSATFGCIERPPDFSVDSNSSVDSGVPTPDASNRIVDAGNMNADRDGDFDGPDVAMLDVGSGADAGPDSSQADADVGPAWTAALVVSDAVASAGGTHPLAERMRGNGVTVEIFSELAAPPDDVDLIVVGQSVEGGSSFDSNLRLAWHPTDMPMLVMKAQATDELGVSVDFADRQQLATRTDVVIVDQDHPIVGGRSGTLMIFDQPSTNFCFTALSPSATIVANTDAEDLGIPCVASVWVMAAGSVLQDETTRTSDRVALILGDGGVYDRWTPAAWQFFDASVDFLLER